MSNSDNLYMGLDSSTQSLKVTLIDESLSVVYEKSVGFDADLSQFKTDGGVHRGEDGLAVTSPTIMWVAALDMLLDIMKSDDCPLERVCALSGSGQQHGSVWMREGSEALLSKLDATQTLEAQLSDAFSVQSSPVWMDSSTGEQCRQLEDSLGGAQAVAELTGSRAYERFTGNQIAKIYQQQPEAYAATERILLVSSFLGSLLAGEYIAIDTSDGSGMNLMDIRSKSWSREALEASAPDLLAKLGDIVPSHSMVGKVAPYYVERYGLNPECAVIAFSGDNPNSLAGLGLQKPGDIAISLGTSDTEFGFLSEPRPSASEGHILVNPVDPEAYMALICYKNGSLTRELVRDEFAGGTWDSYNTSLLRTPPGNNGYVGFYIEEPEITPPILKTGTYRFDANDSPVESFPADVDTRALYEAQFMSMRLHGENIGLRPSTILATGGASRDLGVLRVMSDVFGAAVCTSEKTDSTSLGAAYRALHGWSCVNRGSFVPFAVIMAKAAEPVIKIRPDTQAHEVYNSLLERFARLEAVVLGS
jgi:xylulokinase